MKRGIGALAGAALAFGATQALRRRGGDPDESIVERYFDAWADGDAEALHELLADDYRGHVRALEGTEERDRDALERLLSRHGEAFESTEFDVEDVLRDDGRVAARVRMRARHRETSSEGEIEGLVFLRVEGDRIAEEWSSWDYPGLAEQLGLTGSEAE